MVAASIPLTLDAFTPEWLTAALGERVGGARVRAVQAEPVGAGAGILCHLARLTLEYDQPVAEAPRTLIAKFPTDVAQTRGMVRLFRFYEREVRCYQEVSERLNVGVPALYYGAYDPEPDDFVILMEDLGERRIGDQLAGCSLEDARIVIDTLATLHSSWWNRPALESLAWMPVSNSETNMAGLALYPLAWGPFIERFGHALPAVMVSMGERLGSRFYDILTRFASGPRTVCHGDSRMDNFFFAVAPSQPPVALVDWQIAIRGVGTYDIGYFLSQSMDPAMRATHERDLLRRYHEQLRAGGVTDYSMEQLMEDYRWTLLFCFAYPVMGGGLGDLANERGHALARAMMERSATAISDWDCVRLLD